MAKLIRDGNTNEEIQDLLAKIKLAKDFTKEWHSNIDRWRNLYDMKHYENKKSRPNETQYSDPSHTNTVDLATGIMLANKIRWHSYGIKPSHKEQEETGSVEKIIEGILFINDLREERSNMYEVFRNFNRDGGGVIYSVFDPEIADASKDVIMKPDPTTDQGQVERSVFTEIPVRFQVIDPKKFIAIPGGPKRWQLVGRVEKMTVRDVELIYGVKLPEYQSLTTSQKSGQKGDFMDIWEYVTVTKIKKSEVEGQPDEIMGKNLAVRNTIFFNNFPVKSPQIMEGYRDLPYTVQFFKPVGDESKNFANIMTPMESSVSLLEKSINRRSHQIDVYTGLPIVSKTQPGRVVQVDAGLFSHVQLAPDESIEFPAWPGNAPDVALHIDFLRTRADQSGFSEIMYGSGGAGSASAGYAIAQMIDMNRVRLEQPIVHMELMLTIWAKKVLDLLQVFARGMDICVYGVHKGQDYQDYIDVDSLQGYAVRAEIRPNFPAENSRNVAMATQTKGILSNHTVMEKYLDIEQPEDEEQRKLIEAATFNPVTMQYALIAEMKERAEAGDEVAKMTLQSLMNGMPGQPGRPADPNNPMQPVGGPGSTGLPTPQEQGGVPAGQSATDQQNANVSSISPIGG